MKKLMIVFLILMISILSATQLKVIYEKILKEYEKINTFEATLIQDNYWAEIDLQKESAGKIYYNLDSLYITYLPPDEQQLYIHENTLIVHDIKSKQVIFMDKSDFYIRPQEIIKEFWKDSEKELLEETSEYSRIYLERSGEKFDIWINKDYLITQVMISDEEGNTVSYQFCDEKINRELPVGIFKPEFPENTNIIDNRTIGE